MPAHKHHLARKIASALVLVLIPLVVLWSYRETLPVLRVSPAERLRRQGDALLADGNLVEAVLSYRQAVEAEPENRAARQSLIDGYTRQGRLRLAARYRRSLDAPSLPDFGGVFTGSWINPGHPATPTGIALDGDLLVAAYEDGALLAINAADGSLRWQADLPELVRSAPSLDGSTVYAGAQSGIVYALSRQTGSVLWRYKTGAPVYAAPLPAGNLVYCGSSDGALYALQAQDGQLVWKYATHGPVNAAPALADTHLYVGSADGKLYALDARTGASLWPDGILTGGAVESQPVVAGGRLLFGSSDSRVYSLSPQSGGQYWRYSTPDAIYAGLLVAQDIVYIASNGKTLSAVDFLSGKRLWQTALPAPLRSAPVLIGQRLYQVGETSDQIFILDRLTGEKLASVSTGDWVGSGLLSDGRQLYLAGRDGAVLALRLP